MFTAFLSARFCLAFGMTAMPFLVVGCGNKDAASAQMVAKVDGQEIDVTRMKVMLANAQGVSPENISATKLEILNGLVEQQLAINLAIGNKLDHKPEVLNAIEASRREILARAALDQIADELPAVSEDEVKKYYADNPALFSGRRLFTLQEIVLKKSTSDMAAIRSQIASAKSMEDVSAWLRDKKVEFSSSTSIKAAEQIAPAVLLKLQTFKDGQIGLIESPDAYTITHLIASYAQPIGIVKGMPAAAVFLAQTCVLQKRSNKPKSTCGPRPSSSTSANSLEERRLSRRVPKRTPKRLRKQQPRPTPNPRQRLMLFPRNWPTRRLSNWPGTRPVPNRTVGRPHPGLRRSLSKKESKDSND